MEQSASIFELILSSLSVFTALLFAIQVLFIRNFKSDANKNLSLFFISFTIIQLFQFLYDLHITNIAQYLISLFTPAVLCISPAAYLYALKLTGQAHNYRPVKHYLTPIIILTINVLLFISYFIISYFNINNDSFKSIVTYGLSFTNIIGLIALFSIQAIYYIQSLFKLLKQHREAIGLFFSYEEGITLSWLKTFFGGYIFFVIVAYITNFDIFDSVGWLFDALIMLYLLFVGINANRQVDIYYGLKLVDQKENKIIVHKEINNANNFSENTDEQENTDQVRIDNIKEQVVKIIKEERLYLNRELSLVDIAKKLNSNTKYVSEAINKGFDKNFISLVNEFRIEETKKQLIDPKNDLLTIEAIGYNAGFKSKSSFNTAFKKIVGITPSEYKSKKAKAL